MLSLIKDKIENIDVELLVDTEYGNNQLGGQPQFHAGDDFCIVYAVDTLRMVKAIHNSNTLNEFKDNVKHTWCEEQAISLIENQMK